MSEHLISQQMVHKPHHKRTAQGDPPNSHNSSRWKCKLTQFVFWATGRESVCV